MSSLLASFSEEIASLVEATAFSVLTVHGNSKSLSETSVGSAWIYRDDGYVVTNFHVIDGMREPFVLIDHSMARHQCHLVGSDRFNDLAVLYSKTLGASALSLKTDSPRIGTLCFAVGSPLGLRESASTGIVSGLHRQCSHPSGVLIEDMLQTDASINPGNSGGPLVCVDGRVIGVNTMGTGQNINFSVSAATVAHVVPELIKYGEIKQASLGISVSDNGIENGVPGVAVMSCRGGQNGFKEGDLICSFDGKKIEQKIDLVRGLSRDVIGKVVEAWVIRDGRKTPLSVTPALKP